MLKNDGLLPLKKSVKRVTVIGPAENDDEILWGNYCGYNKNSVTVLQGLKEKLLHANVLFEMGCELSEYFPQLEPVPRDLLFTDVKAKTKKVKVAFYNNPNLWGNAKHEVIESNNNKIWWAKAPFSDIPADNFGACFEAYPSVPEAGRYALGIKGFYDYRFYVNDPLEFSYSSVHHLRKNFCLRNSKAGKMIKIKIEYRHEMVKYAMIKLLWGLLNNDILMKRALAIGIWKERRGPLKQPDLPEVTVPKLICLIRSNG